MVTGMRIYNLFPLLAGSVDRWADHLERIAGMGFDWIYINPFHCPGFSGSLYAIKDFERLHPLLQADSQRSGDELLSDFIAAARRYGIKVMMDLVINHTAKDSLLVERFPHWFVYEENGELRSPRAVDPNNSANVTIWGDLAELDYSNGEIMHEQLQFWNDYLVRHLDLGFHGFRCDAAYQVPCTFWKPLLKNAREHCEDVVFAAETLGCTPEEVLALKEARFDYFFNSAKYWDFREPWLLEQYELYRSVAPTIAFPESHDTERLAAELGHLPPEELERHYRFSYAFTAGFSSGIMMPMGFEYAFPQRLHVVDTRPEHWEMQKSQSPFDLCDFIAEINAVRKSRPALNVEGPQMLLSPAATWPVALLRVAGADARIAHDAALMIINPDKEQHLSVRADALLMNNPGFRGRFRHIYPIPSQSASAELQPQDMLRLPPLQILYYAGQESGAGSDASCTDSDTNGSDPATLNRLNSLSRHRICIESVSPELDGGRFPIKRHSGEVVEVCADIFCDGHDVIAASVLYRRVNSHHWMEAPMRSCDNDRWVGNIGLNEPGIYQYTIKAWRVGFATWRQEYQKKRDADQSVALEQLEGMLLVENAISFALGQDRMQLNAMSLQLRQLRDDTESVERILLSEELAHLMRQYGEHRSVSQYERMLEIWVDRLQARFSSWYELFPRSAGNDECIHGTFNDVINRLPYIRGMGFDVLYFPPIHPIGQINRKGRNNVLEAEPDDVGSPYAIGSEEGGHTDIHSQLGTFDDFHRLVESAHAHGLEIALDFAIQCSPDHPWLKQHPEWFEWRADGSLKHAENPPKKYEDIVNPTFYGRALPSLWLALRDVVLFWIGHGVKIFRVDNPHTKPLPFWEWMIREIKIHHPDVIFLAEAFTRPKMMYRLAKLGFTQSYTYFTWRVHKLELMDYMNDLVCGEAREFFRPNFFVNTPDINPVHLQEGTRATFIVRFVLAATLAGNYGIYNGFELCEAAAVEGKEEYLDSEKYQIKRWDWERSGHIRHEIALVNRIRRENPALQDHRNLRFYNAYDDQVLVYGKSTPDQSNFILIAVHLYGHSAVTASFEVPLWEFGLPDDASIQVEDLVSGSSFVWHGKVQQVALDHLVRPFAIWRLIPPPRRSIQA